MPKNGIFTPYLHIFRCKICSLVFYIQHHAPPHSARYKPPEKHQYRICPIDYYHTTATSDGTADCPSHIIGMKLQRITVPVVEQRCFHKSRAYVGNRQIHALRVCQLLYGCQIAPLIAFRGTIRSGDTYAARSGYRRDGSNLPTTPIVTEIPISRINHHSKPLHIGCYGVFFHTGIKDWILLAHARRQQENVHPSHPRNEPAKAGCRIGGSHVYHLGTHSFGSNLPQGFKPVAATRSHTHNPAAIGYILHGKAMPYARRSTDDYNSFHARTR